MLTAAAEVPALPIKLAAALTHVSLVCQGSGTNVESAFCNLLPIVYFATHAGHPGTNVVLMTSLQSWPVPMHPEHACAAVYPTCTRLIDTSNMSSIHGQVCVAHRVCCVAFRRTTFRTALALGSEP